jgi:hypothetical protein
MEAYGFCKGGGRWKVYGIRYLWIFAEAARLTALVTGVNPDGANLAELRLLRGGGTERLILAGFIGLPGGRWTPSLVEKCNQIVLNAKNAGIQC